MERKLVGVVAGGSYESPFGSVSEFSVSPSPDLLKTLSELPRGAKVGLETMKEFFESDLSVDGLDVDGTKITFSQFGEVYWKEVYGVCVQSGLVPVFLDDLDLHKKQARLKIKIGKSDLEEHDLYFATRSGVEISDRDKPKFRELGALIAESQYIHDIERYERMLKTIKDENVEVVLMSLGFAAYIAQDLEKLKVAGVNFVAYYKDIPDMNFRSSIENRPDTLLANYSQGIGDEDNKTLVHREISLRKHLAYSEGRVSDSRADYVGTFSPNCPPEGLFQVVDNGDGTGSIKDTLGDAVWVGVITDTTIDLRKTYKSSSSDPDALSTEIHYKGVLIGQSYVGKWSASGGVKGDFIMYKGAFYPLNK